MVSLKTFGKFSVCNSLNITFDPIHLFFSSGVSNSKHGSLQKLPQLFFPSLFQVSTVFFYGKFVASPIKRLNMFLHSLSIVLTV